jgi:hypothetical protein
MKCPSLPHRKHVCAVLHVVTRFLCSLSNRLVSNTSSSYTSMLNSSSGKDIKQDKEYILEDALALDLVTLPPTRARLWESVGSQNGLSNPDRP